MRALLVTISILALLAAGPLEAQQDAPKPGPEHAFLKEGVGAWDATVKSNGKESKGTLNCQSVLNGLWLLEQYKGEAAGVPFEGRGATSYDPSKKKFVNIWIDSMSTSPMHSEGTYDKDKKVLTLLGNMPMPDGTTIKSTITVTYKDANTKVMSLKGNMDGKEFELVEITYVRKAK